MRLIQRDFSKDLSVQRVAQEVNLSFSRLRHLFKAEIGLTPSQYVKLLRMNCAKELALSTFLSVKEIVARVGVFDESHFLRDFKRNNGITISAYRRRYGSHYGQ
jgi:two-component system response regulator YesN